MRKMLALARDVGLFVALMVGAIAPEIAWGQPGGGEGVTITAVPQYATVAPGTVGSVAVNFLFSNKQHVWPNKPVVPEGVRDLTAIPTEIALAEGAVVAGVLVKPESAQWPAPSLVEMDIGGGVIKVLSYHEPTTVYVPFKVSIDAQPGQVTVPLVVSFQACDDKQCFAPDERQVSVTFTIGAQNVPTDAALFAGFDAKAGAAAMAQVERVEGVSVSPAGGGGNGAGLGGATAVGAAGPLVIDLGVGGWRIPLDGPVGYVLLFVVAAIGGFVLNLTPCVLPVIPLKILGLQSQAGSRSRMLWLGFVMFLGLVFFWLVIGLLLALGVLRAISEISAYWQFNMAVAVFMAVMGLGMFGLFTVGLPTWVYNIDVKHDSAKGSFGFGIMSAVLATPCVAPLMGGIAAGSTKLPVPVALLLFIFVGIGMGLPYLVLAAYPRLVSWLPKAGPGSELLKQVLGMLMVAISFFFLGSALITLVAEMPWLGKQLHWWAVAVAVGIAAVWLIVRTFAITPSVARRGVFTLLGVAFTAGAVMWANGQTKMAETEWDRREQARLARERAAPGVLSDELWQEYSPSAVERSLADGWVVILDYTADWCLICKTLEATVLHTAEVEAALKSGRVRSFKVDLTSKKAEGWKRLEAIGAKGVPTLEITGPGLERPWIRNAYTVAEVVEGIRQAKGAGGSTGSK